MALDLASQWLLWFFAACAAGGLAGLLVGKLLGLGFEVGLGVGLSIAGATSLSFTPSFALEYREFTTSRWRAEGRVVAVEDRTANADGSVTTPVAIVEFEAGGETHRAASAGGSSLREGDPAVVVYEYGNPARAKVGQPGELRGGAVASLLFGTFPFSAGLYFLLSAALAGRVGPRADARREAAQERSYATVVANVLMVAGITSPLVTTGEVLDQIAIAFGVASLGMWLHVVEGVRMRRSPQWTLGVAVVALNFSVWVAALWLLREPAGW